jgi:diguanylate cyclase (GGDEF)-like protein
MVGGYSRSSRTGLRFVGSNRVHRSRHSRLTVLAVIAGLASLVVAPLSPALTGLVHGVTVIAIAALLIWGPRRHEPLARTRGLLVAALGAVLVSELMIVGFQLIAGYAPTSPGAGDGVSFRYTPLTIAGLLLVPGSRGGTDHRTRALCDGLFAAGSLWFLVAAVANTHVRTGLGHGEWNELAALAIAAGDVCVVATALTVLSRCSLTVARTVGGIAAGITVIAIDDIWLLVSRQSGYSVLSVTLVQIGLLMLLLTAALPPIRSPASLERTLTIRRGLELLPFLPMLACVVVTVNAVLDGQGIPERQVLPAMLMAGALIVRQYSTSRERQQLVGELRERELNLEAELRRDALTGLANRVAMIERLTAALEDRRQWPIAVAVLDLNDFKFINDNHGHVIGDDVLRSVAQRLTETVRDGDLIVRLGGDEFAVVSTRMAAEAREPFAERLLQAFEVPLAVGENRFAVSASVGIVVGEPPQTAGELLAHADAAMYRAKDDKEAYSTIAFLDAEERTQMMRHLLIREAIIRPDLSQFHVHYQPLVDLVTGRISGFESLLRWQHPELGPVPPDVFIPLAERSGSIGVLGDHVLSTTAADLGRIDWRHPDSDIRVGINVSPVQLTQLDFADTFLAKLERAGLPPDRVTLEITEQAFARNLRPVEDAVASLALAGVHIAVDDFGTGYSTLRYLQRLRPSILKIDRSFISGIDTSGESHQLVSAIATMALTLGLQIVAEGIETPEQLSLLQAMGCQLGQGYLFSRAVPIGDAETLLEQAPWEKTWAEDAQDAVG